MKQEPTRVDVVVVGAGLSGLTAATNLQRAGLSCAVLEARDRVGGKTWSIPVEAPGINSLTDEIQGKSERHTKVTVAADVGAAWINDTNQSRMYALAQSFGLSLEVQNIKGDVVFEDFDGKLQRFPYGSTPAEGSEPHGMHDMVRIRQLIEDICHTIDIQNPVSTAFASLDGITLKDWIIQHGGGETALATIKVSTRAMLGLEPEDMSALYFLDYCKSGGGILQMRSDKKDGGQYLRIRNGTQTFSKKLTERLDSGSLHLNCPVVKIEQSTDDDVIVSTDEHENYFECKRVIVSVPTPLYKDIEFSPPLPPKKLKLSQKTMLGYYAKLIVVYKEPWWRDAGCCGMSQSSTGPYTVTRDTSIEDCAHFSLTCFVVGRPGREWSLLTKIQRREAILKQLDRMFGHYTDVPAPVETIEQEWIKETWSQGCPCPVMGPGVMTELLPALREPFGKLHFVGTETGYEWKGYMEGAVRSGERGAQEIVDSFQR